MLFVVLAECLQFDNKTFSNLISAALFDNLSRSAHRGRKARGHQFQKVTFPKQHVGWEHMTDIRKLVRGMNARCNPISACIAPGSTCLEPHGCTSVPLPPPLPLLQSRIRDTTTRFWLHGFCIMYVLKNEFLRANMRRKCSRPCNHYVDPAFCDFIKLTSEFMMPTVSQTCFREVRQILPLLTNKSLRSNQFIISKSQKSIFYF